MSWQVRKQTAGENPVWIAREQHSDLLSAYWSVIDEIARRLGGLDRWEAEELADLDGTPAGTAWGISVGVDDVNDDWLLVEVES